MKTVITTQVGADATLTLRVPLSPDETNKTVRVTVETVEAPAKQMTQEEWSRFIWSMAGQISDPTFQRHEQGEYEHRDTLP